MMEALTHWESFYVIVGSSAAALTGLQFVVVTLIAESTLSASGRGLAAFGTPVVVHFCSALLISAVLSAPWSSMTPVVWAMTLTGLGGLGYGIAVIRRARGQDEYAPVASDWIWHTVLPNFAYACVLLAALALPRSAEIALDVLGGAALLLLFIGIRNSWDTVTYIVITYRRRHDHPKRAPTDEDQAVPPGQ
ncbi:MAG TPA: hypothetical protein VJX91_00965 [Candidatus Eisenbacteria bacterium]|nr:hypothetical protein [Candidatus Eisenbacteria bacterium]